MSQAVWQPRSLSLLSLVAVLGFDSNSRETVVETTARASANPSGPSSLLVLVYLVISGGASSLYQILFFFLSSTYIYIFLFYFPLLLNESDKKFFKFSLETVFSLPQGKILTLIKITQNLTLLLLFLLLLWISVQLEIKFFFFS